MWARGLSGSWFEAFAFYPEELLLPELLDELLPELPEDELDELPEAGDLLEGAIGKSSGN